MSNVLIAVTADHHAGSSLGPVPPEGVPLDDAGSYTPSLLNQWLWQSWDGFWNRAAILRDEKEAELYHVINGDVFEGSHHRSTQVLSGNPDAQNYVASRMMDVPKSLNPNHTFVIRGTGVHAGESSSSEEGFAKTIRAEQCPETGNYSWWELPLHINGWRLFFKHHPPSRGNLPHTQPHGVIRCAKITWDAFHLDGEDPPHIAVFSHIHTFGDSGTAYPTRALITGSWQFETSYVHARIPLAKAEIGGYLILIQPELEPEVRKIQFVTKRTAAWVKE